MAKPINQDIEVQAKTNPPSTYEDLLSFFKDIEMSHDSVSQQFIQLTQTRSNRGPRDSILFAIGIIPPSADITGRLLDRSATVATLADPFEPDAPKASVVVTDEDRVGSDQGKFVGSHKANRATTEEAFFAQYGRNPTLNELQYAQAIAMLETGYGTWTGAMQGSNNWGAVHCTAREEKGGLISKFTLGLTNSSQLGLSRIGVGNCIAFKDKHSSSREYDQSFKSYPTPKDGAQDMIKKIYTNTGAGRGLEDGTIFGASYLMRRDKYYGGFCPNATKQYGAQVAEQSFKYPDKNEGTQACEREAVTEHALRVQQIINDIAVTNGDATKPALGTFEDAQAKFQKKQEKDGGAVGADSGSGAWNQDGSKASKAANKHRAKTAGTSLNDQEKGQRFQAAQSDYIKKLRDAIEKMKRVPPLKMLVNPASFSVKGEKIVQDGNWGRNGPIIEHWGDNQDTISASGKLAGFFAMDSQNTGGPGLTRYARNYSASWQNFQSLFLLYKNNGAVYLPDSFGKKDTTNLAMLGSIYIYYDNILYIGSFSSLNLTEDATKPFSLEYSFEFTVRACFVLDQTDEEFSYGAPNMFRKTLPVAGVTPNGPTNFNTAE